MNYLTLISPINTEKAMSVSSSGIYAFFVEVSSNKASIKKEVEEIFNVKVDKVNIINSRGKKKFFKGVAGKTKSFKKAFVKISSGSINFESGF